MSRVLLRWVGGVVFYVLCPLECILAGVIVWGWCSRGYVAPAELLGTLGITAACAVATWLAYREVLTSRLCQSRLSTMRRRAENCEERSHL